MTTVTEKLKTLPTKPGVYLFKDTHGNIIYIGKAKILKNRVRSYFIHSSSREMRTEIMIRLIADLDYMVVSTELESLILENILIKQHGPRFNILMRDDKNYQFIKLDYSFEIPQIYTVRKLSPSEPPLNLPLSPRLRSGQGEKKRRKYFGPYTSGLAVRNTLYLIKRIFHLCRNKKVGTKSCFAYHLGRCPGVCIGKISIAEYCKTFEQIERFLAHRQTEVLGFLKKEMREAAAAKRFEKAAAVRDNIRNLEHLWERQLIISPKNENQDFLGIYKTDKEAVVNVFMVRGGRLIGQENFELEHDNSSDSEILENFIMQYYTDGSSMPKEIVVPEEPADKDIIEKALSKIRENKVTISKPSRGKKRRLLAMSAENAQMFYDRELTSFEKRLVHVLPDLRNLLNLPTIPRRIEGYDISNIQGTNPVGSMVVFQDARPAKSQYRKFKINTKQTPDDFTMMREMLTRRLRHLPPHLSSPTRGEESKEGGYWPIPDLIVIDGGKGQLNAALKAAQITNPSAAADQIPMIGLAKRLEEIFIPGQKKSIILPPNSPILFLLQQIRDEAHRFAVTFHRSRRGRGQVRSRLDEIPGVGPATRKKLIQKFGSSHGVAAASFEILAEVVGMDKATRVKENL